MTHQDQWTETADRLMQEFFLSASYDPKAFCPADTVKAAIAFALAQQAALADREQPGTDDGNAGGSGQKSLSGEAVAWPDRIVRCPHGVPSAYLCAVCLDAPSSQGGEGGA